MHDIPRPPEEPERPTARRVLMLRPAHFASNPATAASNAFQSRTSSAGAGGGVQIQARREFEALAQALFQVGVDVCVFDDTVEPHKPDAIFPNNWVSFHADGTVVLYPMLAENRRLERRPELIERLARTRGLRVSRIVDLTPHEAGAEYLEGTGSLVLDRTHRLAYACISPRTHISALSDFAQQLDYEIVSFEAHDAAGVPVYHTNVMMCLGADFAVLCADAISNPERRAAVQDILASTGHDVIAISQEQMASFAGNMLALQSAAGDSVIAMSAAAWGSLDAAQRSRLERHGRIVAAAIPTIERFGGGSVRCMLAEVHLPPATP